MKFFSAVLTAILAAVTDARRSNIDLSNRKVDVSKLMRSAVRVDRETLRRLDQEKQQQWQVTGDYSIKFNSCTSLRTQSPNDDVMFGDLIDYTKSGSITAEKSYVLFNVCSTQYCSYDGEDEYVYMVDLATYMASLIEYLPAQRANYCETCQEAQNWCQYGQYQQGDDAAAADGQDNGDGNAQEGDNAEEQGQGEQQGQGEDGQGEEAQGENGQEGQDGGDQGGRKLKANGSGRKLGQNNQNKNYAVVDCEICAKANCFQADNDNGNGNGNGNGNNQDQNNENQVNDENIAEWVQGVIECEQTGQYWGNYALYAGFICNSDGSGVEIGIFLDEDCSIYTSMKSYKNIVSQDYAGYFYNSQEIVTYPFLHNIDCAQEVEYITPEEYYEMQQNGQNQNQNQNQNGDAAEANEYCQDLFDGDEGTAVNLYDCDANGEDDEQNNEVEQDQEQGYEWYAYTLSQNDVENNQAVCKILQTMEGEYTLVYNSDETSGSGSFYNYNSQSKRGRGEGGKKGLLVTLVVVGVVAAMAIAFAAQGTGKPEKNKREALIPEGTMS